MRSFSRHLGASVSAMVDGQLPAADTDRAWRHVLGCPSCRSEVERELWLKQRLASLGAPCPAAGLEESLARWPRAGADDIVVGWSSVVAERSPRRRTGVAVGVGAVSVVALMGWGVTTLVDQTGPAPAGANVGGSPTARPTEPASGTGSGSGGSRSTTGLPPATR